MPKYYLNAVYFVFLIIFMQFTKLTCAENLKIIPVAKGWARNSVNAVIFRHNSIVTHDSSQYVAFYDDSANVLLAKREIETEKWEIRRTQYKGNVRDAHNSISIMVDGDGFLHMAWDQHNNPLNYCRSKKPGSLEMGDKIYMTGNKEQKVTYPEFYKLPGGKLVFIYRDGSSGNGNIMMNIYDTRLKSWAGLQDSFISGEGQRNAYWQAFIDAKGTIHISWVWRETWDVATNHDMCYAKSSDGGETWQRSDGEKYKLPITAASAEYACNIPQNNELINQTSMYVDDNGLPYIATYWKPNGTDVPQYFLVYYDGKKWQNSQVSMRTTPFSLSGGGTKKIPVSRPQLLIRNNGLKNEAFMIFRDIEHENRVSAAICDDLQQMKWRIRDLSSDPVNFWEPTYDTELWLQKGILYLFIQNVGQGDSEELENFPPQMVSVLEWDPGL